MNIKELTYTQAKNHPNTSELVNQAKTLAWDDSESFSDFDLFRLNFNYFQLSDGSWNHSFVILPNQFLDEVSSDWSSQDFNYWVDSKSIYESNLISNLSTCPRRKQLVRSAKFKSI